MKKTTSIRVFVAVGVLALIAIAALHFFNTPTDTEHSEPQTEKATTLSGPQVGETSPKSDATVPILDEFLVYGRDVLFEAPPEHKSEILKIGKEIKRLLDERLERNRQWQRDVLKYGETNEEVAALWDEWTTRADSLSAITESERHRKFRRWIYPQPMTKETKAEREQKITYRHGEIEKLREYAFLQEVTRLLENDTHSDSVRRWLHHRLAILDSADSYYRYPKEVGPEVFRTIGDAILPDRPILQMLADGKIDRSALDRYIAEQRIDEIDEEIPVGTDLDAMQIMKESIIRDAAQYKMRQLLPPRFEKEAREIDAISLSADQLYEQIEKLQGKRV